MRTVTTVCILLFCAMAPTEAALINGTSLSGGTVIDTINGLEWLDLDVTDNLSPDAALGIYSAAGWHWASAEELTGMMDQFFLANGADIPEFRPQPNQTGHIGYEFSRVQFSAWANLFGLTLDDYFSAGFYDDGVNDLNQEGIYWNNSEFTNFSGGLGGAVSWNHGGDSSYQNPPYGIFLVRDASTTVPEPGSIAAMLSLVACGAGAIVVRRRRTKKLAA